MNTFNKLIPFQEFNFITSKDSFTADDIGIYEQACFFIEEEAYHLPFKTLTLNLIDNTHYNLTAHFNDKNIVYSGSWSFKNKTIDFWTEGTGKENDKDCIIIRYPLLLQKNRLIILMTKPIDVIFPKDFKTIPNCYSTDFGYLKK